MKKFFTYALAAVLSTAASQAQVLKYGAEAGETRPDTVNWYGDWVDAGGSIDFEDKNAASGEYAVCVSTPEGAETGASARWERVFKFDGLQIKENTNYRVRLSAQAPENANIHVALMCGDENCDMPFTIKTSTGRYDQYAVLNGWLEGEYTTKAALFRYTTDAIQQEFYPSVKPEDVNPLGPNRFLRLSFLEAGDYYYDDVIVEEADIAGAFCGYEAIKIDFGFPTNIADLVKENGGTITLPNECASVTINGEEVELISVELKEGNLYIFPDASIEETDVVYVSFNAEGSGIKYSGENTPGDGLDVPSVTNEQCFFDPNITASSDAYAEPKLVSSNPEDGSFELDETIDTFSFTFDRDINLAMAGADIVVDGRSVQLTNTSKEGEYGPTVTFSYTGADLTKGSYNVYVYDIESALGVSAIDEFSISFETGKVSVADIEYTDLFTVDVQGENGMASTNWTSYKGEEVWEASGGDQRCFAFPTDGKFSTGFYLSQRGDASASLTYGEKADYPLTLPDGDIQVNILASYWQSNSGSFTYQLLDAAYNIVAEGSGAATTQQPDQNTSVNEVSKISFNYEGCKAGNYILKLTTSTGGYGNAIIVWGLDVKSYKIGQGETADNVVVVNGTFADVAGDGVPAAGSGWHVYQDNILLTPGSVAGQRTRFMTLNKVANLPIAFYNRDLGGASEKHYMTYGETTHADGSDPCVDAEGNPVEEKTLELDVARHNFSWYICNWKGDSQTYYFHIYDEDGIEVYTREDVCTLNINGNRDAGVEAQKVEFAWTPKNAGLYTMKWNMTGEAMVGNIKIEKMGSMAVYWHTQLNTAIKAAEEERANAEADIYAGTTRDALDAAIAEAKTVTYHTGKEYTAAIDRLAQFVKDMKSRRDALAEYDKAYADLAAQIGEMAESKFVALASYNTGKALVEKYAGVEGYTIPNETLLPLVTELSTTKALNQSLMNIGVGVFTDQINKLVATYNQLCEKAYGDDDPGFEFVLACEELVADDQEVVAKLKKLVTATVYKAVANGYDFKELEFPDEEPSEDNPYIDTPLDLTGFVRNSVFYCLSPKNQTANTEATNAAFPGWQFDAANGIAPDWGWGGWNGDNQPIAPVNVTNSQAGTKFATDFKVWQDITDVPTGIYSIGGDVTDRSNVGDDNVIKPGYETLSYIYIEDTETGVYEQKTFDITNIGTYYGMTETMIDEVTINNGKITFGAMCDVDGSFAAIDNVKLRMSAKDPSFNYALAAESALNDFVTGIKAEPATSEIVATKYFDLNGRQVENAQGILIRVDSFSNGTVRTMKVIRK